MTSFKSNTDINQKFYGLVGVKKLILLPESPVQELLNEGIINELIELLAKFQFKKSALLNFKTNIHISLKRVNVQPIIDFSERICVTSMKRKKKFK